MSNPIHADEHVHPPPPAYTLVPPTMPAEREVSSGNRPELPHRARNLFLHQGLSPTANDPDALVVKFQTIVRDGKEIIVGRLKVPTLLPAPLEHAFILRRYDTGAISVTTMYKAAFPSAVQEEEDREMKWIKSSFDMSGMNGSRTCDAVKLAGNWAPLNLARHLAPAYKLEAWIEAMCTARPEAGVAYRKSQRSQKAAEEAQKPPVAPPMPSTLAPAAAPTPAQPISPVSARQQPARNGIVAPAHAPSPLAARPAAAASGEAPRSQTTTPARAIKRSRLSQIDPPSPSTNSSPSAPAPVPAGAVDHVTVTLQSTHELHAPLATSATELSEAAAAEIAASKADVLRLREEALIRSAAGESAAEMGLVSAEPGVSGGPGSSLASQATGGVRGIKRRTEDVAVEEDAAEANAAESNATTVLTHSGEGRVIAGNRRIVNRERAEQRQGFWGPVAMLAGTAASFVAASMLW